MLSNFYLKNKPYLFKRIIGAYLLFFAVFFIVMADISVEYANKGMVVFRDTVMPTVVPYAFAVTFINALIGKDLRHLFTPLSKRAKLSADGFYCCFLGLIGGYPLGASTALSAYSNNAFSESEFYKIICITSVASPLLTITCVGKLTYGSFTLGICMFLAQMLSAFFAYQISDKRTDKTTLQPFCVNNDFDGYLTSIIKSLAINCVLTVFFYTLLSLTFYCLPKNAIIDNCIIKGLLSGFIETNFSLEVLSLIKSPLSFAVANSVLAFGGAPVFLQTKFIANKIKIRTSRLLFFKLAQSLFCFLLTFIFASLIFLTRLF